MEPSKDMLYDPETVKLLERMMLEEDEQTYRAGVKGRLSPVLSRIITHLTEMSMQDPATLMVTSPHQAVTATAEKHLAHRMSDSDTDVAAELAAADVVTEVKSDANKPFILWVGHIKT